MFEKTSFDDETIKLFEELSDEDPLDLLSKYICPELVGKTYETVRKATLLLLVTEYDVYSRYRLHELLWGDAGTGKTELLSWIEQHVQGVKINAEMTSKTGLIGDARGNSITGGLLHQYDGNVVCIDELDKMRAVDQNGLLQAMEEGEYMIVKGKKREKFRAEIRAIASANDIEKIIRPLLDRFDFVFHLTRPTRSDRARSTLTLVKNFIGQTEKHEIGILTSYLEWIKEYEPTIQESDLNTVADLIKTYIKRTRTDIDPISFRNLEHSILRIGYAMAKLERKDIKPDHIKRAILFKDNIIENLKYGV